jgi:hypothetical protein
MACSSAALRDLCEKLDFLTDISADRFHLELFPRGTKPEAVASAVAAKTAKKLDTTATLAEAGVTQGALIVAVLRTSTAIPVAFTGLEGQAHVTTAPLANTADAVALAGVMNPFSSAVAGIVPPINIQAEFTDLVRMALNERDRSKQGFIVPNDSYIRRAMSRDLHSIDVVIRARDPNAAYLIYDNAKTLPGTMTDARLVSEGYVALGPIEPTKKCELIEYFNYETYDSLVVKSVTRDEASRVHTLQNGIIPHLVHFTLHPNYIANVAPGSDTDPNPLHFTMSMHKHRLSLALYSDQCRMTNGQRRLLWNSMVTVLNSLHAMNLAHMDVKPANICISTDGLDFVLIDVGSVAPYNTNTSSTRAYLPVELASTPQKSAKKVDWWMLAMTLMDVASFRPANVTNSFYTCQRVLDFLKDPTHFDPAIWAELEGKLSAPLE